MSIGEIVAGSTKVQTEKRGGRADVQTLLIHTPIHPKGRIEIDPLTGMVKNPKSATVFTKQLKVKVDGVVVGQQTVAVNGGHARDEGSVWRTGLKGPAYYHQMVINDDWRHTFLGKNDRTACELTSDELQEYQYFRAYLATGKADFPTPSKDAVSRNAAVYDALDEKFYAWLKKQDTSKIELLPLSVTHTAAPAVTPVK